jgi:hypothetical protein
MGRSGRGLLSYSELRGGSPHLCQLRTTSVGPCGTSIDYVLMHTRFMGYHKLSSFDSHRVGRYLTLPTVMYIGTVYGPPMDSLERYRVEYVHKGKV